jgi:phenylpropionate dioxygenase-like ring-hydroxylating dioxygenase large terminal subunit
MFINFWYVAGKSDELTDQPVKRRMIGQDFVLFRDADGIARCLSNTCTHRGGSLGSGKVNNGNVQCPYHGWEFDGQGRCRKIPSLGPDARVPKRARVDAYPTEERYGLVFAFLGDLPEEERIPIMDIPQYRGATPDEGWRSTIQAFDWDFDYKRSIENGIDGAHNEYVHPTHSYSGERETFVPAPKLEFTDWGVGFWGEREAPPLPDKKMREASGREGDAIIRGGTGHHGISCLWTHINPMPDMHIHQYLFETPIDLNHTSLYLVNMRNFLLDEEGDERMMSRNEVVATQDRDVLLDVQPKQTPETRTHEFFVPSDGAVAAYRDRLKEWEARGWRIDTDAVERNRLKVAYAIPSPERRTEKGWILDAVPLLPADTSFTATQTHGAELGA